MSQRQLEAFVADGFLELGLVHCMPAYSTSCVATCPYSSGDDSFLKARVVL